MGSRQLLADSIWTAVFTWIATECESHTQLLSDPEHVLFPVLIDQVEREESAKARPKGLVFWVPVARAEYRSHTGSSQASPVFEPEARILRPASWRAPCGARNGGRSRALRGVLSFGYLSLHEQRKVTQGAGAEPPAISFLSSAKPTQQIVRWVTAKTA